MRKYLIAAALIIFFTGTYGKTLYEHSLKDFGYEDMKATSYKCRDYAIVLPDLNGFVYLTLFAKFVPENTGSASIECNINGHQLARLYANEFSCTEGEYCVAYLHIKKAFLKAENTLRVCLKPSESIVKIILSNKSRIGIYKQGVFRESDFHKCVVSGNRCVKSYHAVLGEDLNVRISVKNSGNEKARITVEAIRPIVGDSAVRKELGNVRFSAVVRPHEEKYFYHSVRVGRLVRFNLPPAALYYIDAFGRKHLVFSNVVTIFPKKQPDVNAMLFIKDINRDYAQLSVVLTNSSGVKIKNAGVQLIYNSASLGKKQVLNIGARSSATANFVVENAPGATVKCMVELRDYNLQVGCNTVELPKSAESILPIIIASAFLIAVAAAVFIYLNSRPE